MAKLPTTAFSGIDYANIIKDVTDLVTNNPEYNSNWDDFLSSNAGRMLIDLFAYITDNLATRIDLMVNENYLSTATQKKSIMKILKLIGYNFSLGYASNVIANLTIDQFFTNTAIPSNNHAYYLTEPYDASTGNLNLFSLSAIGLDGVSRNYEVFPDQDVYDYKSGVSINCGTTANQVTSFNIRFREGTTKTKSSTITTTDSATIELTETNIIDDSIQLYLVTGAGLTTIETELVFVDNFLEPVAQRYKDPTTLVINPIPYTRIVNEDGSVTLEFGSISLLPLDTRRPAVGDKIKIYYRVGGGSNGNLTSNSLSASRRIEIGASNVNFTFNNPAGGYGGQDPETAQDAIVRAPSTIKTVGKAVTPDDYNTLLSNNSGYITSASYGKSNMPTDIFDNYGVYIKPLEVWNYIVKQTPNWTSFLPSQYIDARWGSLRLENRFNNLNAFTAGSFSNTYPELPINNIPNSVVKYSLTRKRMLNNFVIIKTPADFIANFGVSSFSSFFSKAATFQNENNLANYFKYSTSNGYINNTLGNGVNVFLKPKRAKFESQINLFSNLLASPSVPSLSMKIDGGNTVVVSGIVAGTSINAIVTAINSAFGTAKGTVGAPGSQTINFSSASFTSSGELSLYVNGRLVKINGSFTNTSGLASALNTQFQTLDNAMKTSILPDGNPDAITFQGSVGTNILTITNGFERIELGMCVNSAVITGTNVAYVASLDESNKSITIETISGSVVNLNSSSGGILEIQKYVATSTSLTLVITEANQTSSAVTNYNPVYLVENIFSSSISGSVLTHATPAFLNATTPSATATIYTNQYSSPNSWFNPYTPSTVVFPTLLSPTTLKFYINSVPYSITVDGATTWNSLVTIIQNAIGSVLYTVALTNGSILSSTVLSSGSGYSNGTVSLVGTGGTVNITSVSSGVITGISLAAGGTGYTTSISSTNGYVQIVGGGGTGGLATITASNGVITGVTLINGGTGYSVTGGVPLNTYGTGASLTLTTTGGVITSMVLASAGTGYSTGTYAIPGGTGGTVSVIANAGNVKFTSNGWSGSLDVEPYETSEIENLLGQIMYPDLDGAVIYNSAVPFVGLESNNSGSYSHVAKIRRQFNSTAQFITLESPSMGPGSTIEVLKTIASPTEASDFTLVSGFSVGAVVKNYGKENVFIMTDSTNANYGYIYYENGQAINYPINLYLSYFFGNGNKILIGTYKNDTYETTDPKWREPNDRVYSTSYNTYGLIDYAASDFIVKFTRNPVAARSIYSIQNSWDLSVATPATQTSLGLLGGALTYGNTYRFFVSFDIDATLGPADPYIYASPANSGKIKVDVVPPSSYVNLNTTGIANQINAQIQTYFVSNYSLLPQRYRNPLYTNFTYATYDITGNKIIITNPSVDYDFSGVDVNGNSVTPVVSSFYLEAYDNTKTLEPDYSPFPNIVDGFGPIFGSGTTTTATDPAYPGGRSFTWKVSTIAGDYFLRQVSTKGPLSSASVVTGGSGYTTGSVMVPGGTDGQIQITAVNGVIVSASILNYGFGYTSGVFEVPGGSGGTIDIVSPGYAYEGKTLYPMEIVKLPNSNIPIGYLQVHFVADKRFVDGIYDGEAGRAGYPLNTVDEDGFNNYLSTTKIIGIDNTFKEPIISAFSILGTIYYKKPYTEDSIRTALYNQLQTEYDITNRGFNNPVNVSKIIASVHDSSPAGISHAEISLLFKNDVEQTPSVGNILPCASDEILVLSEDIYGPTGAKISGLILNYILED